MNSGWVKTHRKVWENPRASNPQWYALWGYLLCHATHRPIPAIFGSKVVTLAPGQLVTGRDSISKATGIHRSSVERLLNIMEIEHQIEQQTSTKNRLISIKNWEKYQGCDEDEQQTEQQASSGRATSEHIQEGEEVKNKEREAPAAPRRPRERKRIDFEPAGDNLKIFKAWKMHFPQDDAPRMQTCKNIQGRLTTHPLPALLFSVLSYRGAVTKAAAARPDGVIPYKGSNFFGEKAYFLDYLPKDEQLAHPKVQERLQAVLAALEPQPESSAE